MSVYYFCSIVCAAADSLAAVIRQAWCVHNWAQSSGDLQGVLTAEGAVPTSLLFLGHVYARQDCRAAQAAKHCSCSLPVIYEGWD